MGKLTCRQRSGLTTHVGADGYPDPDTSCIHVMHTCACACCTCTCTCACACYVCMYVVLGSRFPRVSWGYKGMDGAHKLHQTLSQSMWIGKSIHAQWPTGGHSLAYIDHICAHMSAIYHLTSLPHLGTVKPHLELCTGPVAHSLCHRLLA